MIDLDFSFDATVWKYAGKAAWYFVTLPKDMADDIKDFTRHQKTGWGSVRVHASIGETSWKTSIFPDKKSGAYLLPLKAAIRTAEGIGDGDAVSVGLRVEI